MGRDNPSKTTLTVCFWLGMFGWPWGFLIAAVIGGTSGFLKALKGMFVCWFVIVTLILVSALLSSVIASA